MYTCQTGNSLSPEIQDLGSWQFAEGNLMLCEIGYFCLRKILKPFLDIMNAEIKPFSTFKIKMTAMFRRFPFNNPFKPSDLTAVPALYTIQLD